ncbi:hypothetical protein D3273_27040 [Lichenibacterium minor]|uniref:Uncharacterized protein n=1 Tax=Lichenibacterium minor TaxID=2316528 RepID=A0A4Q2U2G4_9HYPH|nr:hypothetical protein [Lichenibacterium minor]RYC28866.1 hypothetical protein D3273_27040 [Lichenibacterium minor]
MDDSPTTETSCPHMAAWLATKPHFPGPLDAPGMAYIGEKLMEMGAVAAQAGWKVEFRGALVKVLAGTVAASMADMTEDQAFALSLELREALYLEILRFRRAAQLDHNAGAFDA